MIRNNTTHIIEYRPVDGRGNNINYPEWGTFLHPYVRRYLGPAYEDGISEPSGYDRPSPREITNTIGTKQRGVNTRRVSDFHTFWGQFLAIDVSIGTTNGSDPLPIEIPHCDDYKDPFCEGNKTMVFHRNLYVDGNF